MTVPTNDPPGPRRDPANDYQLLRGLFDAALTRSRDEYLALHAREQSIRRQVAVFHRYLPHLPESGVFLDWGCRHAPDACLLRAALGDAVELHGCDLEDGHSPVFHEFARLDFRRLTDPRKLPYADGAFDVVVGGGVIEHTADDSASLRELHRVLREGGMLVLTFIPNRLSYTEFLSRRLGLGRVHRRLYGRTEVRRMLLHHGFEPVLLANHQLLPAHRWPRAASGAWRLNGALERVWPVNRLSTNLMVIARRRLSM